MLIYKVKKYALEVNWLYKTYLNTNVYLFGC